METINFRRIVKQAWNFAQEEKRLMYYYAFLPSLITTFTGIFYIVYQVLSFKRYLEAESSIMFELAKFGWTFLGEYPQVIPIALMLGITLAFLYLFYPSFNEGALIQFIARRYNGQTIKMRHGLGYGSKSFFPILEFNGLLSFLSFSALLGYATLTWRNLGFEVFRIVGVILVFAALLSVVFSFLFTYTRFFIVIDKEGVFSAIGKSTDLVIDQWHSTFLMILILFLIGLRIVLNIVLILVIPGLVVLLGGLFASLALNFIGYIVAATIGLFGLFVAGYLGGTLSVFSHAVWTFTFLELTKDDQLDARSQV